MRVIVLLVLAVVLIHPAGAADKQAAPSATVARRQKLASAFPVSAVHELAALEWAREAVPERRTEAQRQLKPGPLAPIVQDLLKRIAGYEAAGIIEPPRSSSDTEPDFISSARRRAPSSSGPLDFLMLEADPAVLAGVHVAGQVIVLNAAQTGLRDGPAARCCISSSTESGRRRKPIAGSLE